MATNADLEETETSVEESDLENELKAEKEALDTKSEEPQAEETTEEAESKDEATEAEEEAQAEPEATFTKPVPSIKGETPEEYTANLAKAYQESTKEALRLKGELDKKVESSDTTGLTPEQLYIRQKQDEEIATAFADITKNYPQASDPKEYEQFTKMANTLGRTILDAEGRLASPKELYQKTVVLLGWTAEDNKEKLGAAVKGSAEEARTSSGTPAPAQKSKVTEAMIKTNMKMFPNKTRQEIIEELEPHIT